MKRLPDSARVLLMGYYGARNLGDDLMLVCLRHWLTRQGYRPTILAENAAQVRQQFGFETIQNVSLLGQFGWVNSFARLQSPALVMKVLGYDALCAGGGDILRDAIGWRGFSYQVEKLLLAVAAGKPCYLVNVGITEPVTERGRKILDWLLPKLAGIFVRDDRSLRFCEERGVKAVLTPDIVLELPQIVPLPPADDSPRNTILVALHRDPNTYRQFDLTETRLSQLASSLSHVCQAEGAGIRFLSCQWSRSGADDHATHRRLAERLAPNVPVEYLDWTSDPVTLAGHYRQARCVLAMRLHAGVLAAAFGRPCVLLPYERKVVEFGEAAGIDRWIYDRSLDDAAETERTIRSALTGEPYRFALPARAASWLNLTLE